MRSDLCFLWHPNIYGDQRINSKCRGYDGVLVYVRFQLLYCWWILLWRGQPDVYFIKTFNKHKFHFSNLILSPTFFLHLLTISVCVCVWECVSVWVCVSEWVSEWEFWQPGPRVLTVCCRDIVLTEVKHVLFFSLSFLSLPVSATPRKTEKKKKGNQNHQSSCWDIETQSAVTSMRLRSCDWRGRSELEWFGIRK